MPTPFGAGIPTGIAASGPGHFFVDPEKLVSNKIIQFFERMHMIMKAELNEFSV